MPDNVAVFRESTVSPAAHELYRMLIDAFVESGKVPGNLDSTLLEELAVEDWLALDEHGHVAVLYPFSLSPSGIDVSVDGADRHAMCAIDALGIASMLDAKVEINATCPISGERLVMRASGKAVESSSSEGIVVVRRRTGGAAHVSRCAATRFFRSPADAEAWLVSEGDAGDVVLSLDEAYDEARTVFGRAYTDGVRMMVSD
jgi:hypothetical protein